ncbi:tyrosine-type recombinase/integrase [Oleiharenicola lentus]|uniref:tyrosine-type recombinase/integrase n=1 Tax=Oleiharenicola lentus TaxID=2508720 RepID=UPI003F66BF19
MKTTPLTHSECDALLALASTLNARDGLLIVAALKSGFRVSELLAIRIQDVWHNGAARPTLTIARRLLKGGRGVHRRSVPSRTIPIGAALAAALARYVPTRLASGAQPSDMLFASRVRGRALSRWQARTILHQALWRVGISTESACYGMHSCRKAFARAVYGSSGHDLRLTQRAMNHRYSSTTEAYLAITDDETAAVISAFG